jgi:hypothetical protein
MPIHKPFSRMIGVKPARSARPGSPGAKLRAAGLFLLMAVLTPSARGLRTVQPLHFFVEDALIRAVPLAQWNDQLLRVVAVADLILCDEMKRAEKIRVCDLSLRGAVSVTPFDRPLEDGLRRTWPDATLPGAVNQEGLNFLFEQTDTSERRIYVVRRILSCGGEQMEAEACTRVSERATVIAFRGLPYRTNDNAITLLHELGHQVGLADGPDPRALMYRGWPRPRVGTLLKAAEVGYFRRLLPAS